MIRDFAPFYPACPVGAPSPSFASCLLLTWGERSCWRTCCLKNYRLSELTGWIAARFCSPSSTHPLRHASPIFSLSSSFSQPVLPPLHAYAYSHLVLLAPIHSALSNLKFSFLLGACGCFLWGIPFCAWLREAGFQTQELQQGVDWVPYSHHLFSAISYSSHWSTIESQFFKETAHSAFAWEFWIVARWPPHWVCACPNDV